MHSGKLCRRRRRRWNVRCRRWLHNGTNKRPPGAFVSKLLPGRCTIRARPRKRVPAKFEFASPADVYPFDERSSAIKSERVNKNSQSESLVSAAMSCVPVCHTLLRIYAFYEMHTRDVNLISLSLSLSLSSFSFFLSFFLSLDVNGHSRVCP